jgi:hypothetical protein
VGNVNAIERDAAMRGRQELGQQIEKGGFTSAVGADQCMDMSALDLQIHVIDGNEPLELLAQAAGFQNELD